jgi:hypothetical protein
MANIDPNIRETNIAQNTGPTGRVFKIQSWAANPSLYEIVFADNRPGELPSKFQNHRFTKRPLAQAYLKKVLNDLWDEAEDKTHTKRSNVA